MPMPGHGYRFYLGEAAFPIVAAFALPLSALTGYLAGRLTERRGLTSG